MRLIKNIGLGIALFGVCGVPGAIEFGNWIPALLAIFVGGSTYLIIEKGWHIEEKTNKHNRNHKHDYRPKYLR